MKFFIAILFLFASFNAVAQNKYLFKSQPVQEWKKKNGFSDTLKGGMIRPLLVLPHQDLNKAPDNKEAVVRLQLKGRYLGNNKAGADIYAMEPYKMPCLVPDSTYKSSMPIVRKQMKIMNLSKD